MEKEDGKYNVEVSLHGKLGFFLPANRKEKEISVNFKGRRSIKDLIESMGVPHVEIDQIIANGVSVPFSYIVKDMDRFEVYPVFEVYSIFESTILRPAPIVHIKFVLDVHLRKLARKLRILGFDVDFNEDRNDSELAEISEKENRILLTRDLMLLMRKNVTFGLYVRSIHIEKQVTEIVDRLDLKNHIRPFTRCSRCNGHIKNLDLKSEEFESRKHNIPTGVLRWCQRYYLCQNCEQVYWEGSHFDKLDKFIHEIIE